MSLIGGFLIGIMGSIHCVAMCGPLALAVNYKQKNLLKNLVYHLGRLTTYMILGLILGLLGEGLSLAGAQRWISILSGITILLITFIPQVKKHLAPSSHLHQLIFILMKQKLLSIVENSKMTTMFILGFLNGLLPCGLVYLAVASALAIGDVVESGLLMMGFGLATFPALLSVAMGGKMLFNFLGWKRIYILPVFTVLLATILIIRGMALEIPYLSPVINNFSQEGEITTCQTQ